MTRGQSMTERVFLVGTVALALLLVVNSNIEQNAYAGPALHVPAQFPTIQAAVDAAKAGDTIKVAHGTFSENVLIDGKSDVSLRGQNTLLLGSGSGIGIHILNSDRIWIRGFTVDGYEAGIVLDNTNNSRIHHVNTRNHDSADSSLRDGLQLVNSHFNYVAHVNALDNGHNGFTLKLQSTNNVLRHLRGNNNGQNPAVAASFGGCGIQLIGSDNNNNIIAFSETIRNGWGIQVGGGSNDNAVSHNRSHLNQRAGVVVLDPGMMNLINMNLATRNGLANIGPSFTFDLFDQGALDNTWMKNRGDANF